VTGLFLGVVLFGVASFIVASAPALAQSAGPQIVVEGNRRVEAETIRSYFKVPPGERLDAARIDSALKALYSSGLFQDIRISQSGGRLIVTVVEAPVIDRIAFEGNNKLKDEQLQQEIQSKARGTLSKAMVQADVVVIGDGVDVATFSLPTERERSGSMRPTPDGAAGGAIVAMVSRIHPLKGQGLFLRAAKIVHERNPDTTFLLVGGCLPAYEGHRQRLLLLKDRLGLAAAAHFVPQINRDSLPEFFRSLTVAVVPSIWVEPGGLVVLEAMASGTPVAAYPAPGPIDIIPNSGAGALAKSATEGLREACLEALTLDRKQVRAFAEKFSWRACAEDFVRNLQPYPEPEKTRFWRRLRRLARVRRRPAAA